jgi:hypothetical protein
MDHARPGDAAALEGGGLMPWGRLDDKFYSHPKIIAAGLSATGLFALSLSYCAAHGTDGLVPQGALTNFNGWKPAARRLVTIRLWETVDGGGWRIHDYLDWNPSHEEVLRDRQAAAERKRAKSPGLRPDSNETGRSADSGDPPGPVPLHATPDVPDGTPYAPPNPPRRARGANSRNSHGLSDQDREELRLMDAQAIRVGTG